MARAFSLTENKNLRGKARGAGGGEPERKKIRSLSRVKWLGESFGEATMMRDRELTRKN